MRNVLVFGVVLALAAVWARALPIGPATRQVNEQQRREMVSELEQEMLGQFKAGKYDEGAETARRVIELVPRNPSAHYNLACALARMGKAEDAIASLEKAVELGFADADHLEADDDLASLRTDARYDKAVKSARAKGDKATPVEAGAKIEGVKTVEGKPEGGLAWRLRISPNATKENPSPLVIWLHPSGGSGNRLAESLALRLTNNGFALLVLTQKQWAGWTDSEARRLIEKTLPDVAKAEGVDAKRPILMGFSAGGQMALQLWSQGPGRFRGLILDAAYPIQLSDENGLVKQDTLVPPRDEAIKGVPIYVLVGKDDQQGRGAESWAKVEKDWRAAGVPLTITIVPDKGHEWLVGKPEADALEAWLKQTIAK